MKFSDNYSTYKHDIVPIVYV